MLIHIQVTNLSRLPTQSTYTISSIRPILTNTQNQTQKSIENQESINIHLLGLMDQIPFHSWGGAINMTRNTILELIPSENYSTLIAICQKFLHMPDIYWNDNRDRDFSGIIESIEKRLWELGYEVTEHETQHYMDSSSKKRIHIPTAIKKIS